MASDALPVEPPVLPNAVLWCNSSCLALKLSCSYEDVEPRQQVPCGFGLLPRILLQHFFEKLNPIE